MSYEKEFEYEGEFQSGLLHGKGKLRYFNGDTFIGDFDNDLPNGSGTFTSNNGKKTYSGEWKLGRKEGNGEYIVQIENENGSFQSAIYRG